MDLQNDKPADVGTVVEIQNGFAIVEYSRSDACNTCKLKPFCFQRGGDVNTLTMKNELNVKKVIKYNLKSVLRCAFSALSSYLFFQLFYDRFIFFMQKCDRSF